MGPSEIESASCQYEYLYISRNAMSQKLSTCILILLIEMTCFSFRHILTSTALLQILLTEKGKKKDSFMFVFYGLGDL